MAALLTSATMCHRSMAASIAELTGGTLADGLTVSRIAVLQYAQLPIVEAGIWNAAPGGPIISGRDARLRVYVTVDVGWGAQSIRGELTIQNGSATQTYFDTKSVSQNSDDTIPGSFFEFVIPASEHMPGTAFNVQLFVASSGSNSPPGNHNARFPRDGSFQALGSETNRALEIVVVPIKYDADGSGRLPDTTPAAIEKLRGFFCRRVPDPYCEHKRSRVSGLGFGDRSDRFERLV